MLKNIKGKKLFIVVFIIMLIASGCHMMFPRPTKKYIDQVFLVCSEEKNKEKRISLMKKCLREIIDASEHPDEILDYFFDKAYALCLNTDDDAILIAIDNTPTDTGFTTTVCTFYDKVKFTKVFSKRYSNNPKAKNQIRYCIGIFLPSEEELDKILNQSKTLNP